MTSSRTVPVTRAPDGSTDAADPDALEIFPPVDLSVPQLTIRTVCTGMVIGGVLSLCNVYSGLKIGWGFNMSITACLLGFGLWQGLHKLAGTRAFGPHENNMSQTAASSAASISSAGLVAGIPALSMLTGYRWTFGVLVAFTFAVCLVGIVVALGLRRQMIVVERLKFPSGIATAATLEQMYAHGSEAIYRVWMLIAGAVAAGVLKLVTHLAEIHNLVFPGSFAASGAAATAGAQRITVANLGWAFEPSLLMYAVGALVGLRAGASIMIGSVIAWGVLAPIALSQGWASVGPADPEASWYGALLKWLLWPGVAMMVSSSLTSFAFSWRSVLASFTPKKKDPDAMAREESEHGVPRDVYMGALALVLVLATVVQIAFFDISWWTAAIGVLLTFVLAIVAGRVAGETNVTPVGAMGKVTQLTFGVMSPGNAAANLMSATVTGGAASQCADLLHDMKTGALLGSSPRYQAVAQTFGAVAGSLLGCAGFLLMIPDPEHMLMTDEWPAPAVASWRAVAEIFMRGIDAMPPAAFEAMAIGGVAGIVLAVLEKTLPKSVAKWVPSPASMGLAFVVPAYNCVSIFFGAIMAAVAGRFAPKWSARFVLVLAAGFIAGESLVGVGIAIHSAVKQMIGG